MTDPSHLFTLRVKLRDGSTVSIYAYDAHARTHHRIDVEVTHRGATIFARGQLYCGLPSSRTIDGIAARELVLSLVAMRPGDTDRDYFTDYTPVQLAWADAHGEEIGMVRETRYCDAAGNVRDDLR